MEEKAVALGVEKIRRDGGGQRQLFFSISVTPDDRWPNAAIVSTISTRHQPSRILKSFRRPARTKDRGRRARRWQMPGRTKRSTFGPTAQLQGVVIFSNSPPAIQWKLYSGPGTVTFGNAALTNTTATFSAPGVYTLELSADDGVHAVAYDAVVITVTNVISMSITLAGTNLNVSWIGGTAPFVVQQTGVLPAASWSNIVTTSASSTYLPVTGTVGFFRVQGQ